MSITIRPEREDDREAIARLIPAAFRGAPHGDGDEAAIVARLRAAGALALSLVAEDEEGIVGHIALSPVTIDCEDLGWFGLGPVAVDPAHQSKGYGSALIEDGLARLRAAGASGCVVLGEPA